MSFRHARATYAGLLVAISAVVAVGVSGCGADAPPDPNAEPMCLAAPVSTDCNPYVEPNFEQLFKHVFSICADAGCHSGSAPQGGFKLDDMNTAYANLLAMDSAGDEPRVTKGDLQCGKVIVRTETAGKSWSMPAAGGQLTEEQRCSIRQWIAAGAPGPTGASQ